jgi:predicted phage-related endonuclease
MNEILQQVLIALLTVASALLTMLINKYVAKLNLERQDKEITDIILEGMAKAQNDFVRAAKAAAADGKLTPEEIKQAQQIVIDYVKSNAAPNVLEIVERWTVNKFDSIIKQQLRKFK